jgi:hypothetical protein
LGSLLEAKSTFTRLWYRQLLLCEAQKVVDKTYGVMKGIRKLKQKL